MKKLRLYFLALPLLMLSQGAWADGFSGGTGTSSDPYLISSVSDLQELSTMSNSSSWSTYQTAYYKVTADIDMSSVANFEPICHTTTTDNGFMGTFDGDGHVISNLKMTVAADNAGHIGLIGCLQTKSGVGSGSIKNVILNGVTITNNMGGVEEFSIGGLSGRDGSCTIENCAVLGFSISKENAKKPNSNGTTIHGNGPFGYLSSSDASILRFCCTDYSSLAVMGSKAVIENSVKAGETLNIATNENLVYFGKYVNAGYASLKGKVTANINMSGKAWTGMTGFAGTFDGGDFTISNLAAPLCLTTAGSATIKNLTLEGELNFTSAVNGAFVGTADGTSLTLSNCTNNTTIETNSSNCGGFIGCVATNTTIEECQNKGNVTATGTAIQIGGFVGKFQTTSAKTLKLTDCTNTGAVSNEKSGDNSRAGGFIGWISQTQNNTVEITGCTNEGSITGTGQQVGGFIGFAGSSTETDNATITITGSENNGNITADAGAGGIIGQLIYIKTVKLSGNCNTAVIKSNTTSMDSRAGGMIGFIWTATSVSIDRCWNSGYINASLNRPGGILGSDYKGTIDISNCYNIGKISATSAGRAILGFNATGTVSITNCWAKGDIQSKSLSTVTYTNCYYAHIDADGTGVTKVTADQLASGEVAYKLGDAWYQTIGTDDYPIFDETHGIVNYISAAGYTTQYIPSTDVVIPSGVEAYAGVIKGSSVSLVAIENAISKEDAVVLKGDEGYYSFVPTTGATQAATNDLQGSDGTKNGGEGIYALAKKNDVVGFYPVAASVTIPAGKAYIEYSGAGVKGFNFVFDGDDATGIGLTPDPSPVGEGSIYNLAGQMVNGKLPKGIYIVNGKKVLK
ncbi:MAG: hypothetical protein IJ537_07725 [Bacteroidaceae bacterium]|nr:hypothetical protein [Bacteroidaceae bacterium]